MNLQENYKQLFKGKARSNDTSILREAKYNIKVTKHDVRSKEKGAKGFAVTYEGTISGPGIPNGTEWYGGGIAGDVIDAEKIPGWNPDGKDGYWSDGLTITFIMDLQPTGNVYVYHPNNTNYKNKDERQDWETESKRTHVFTKEVKDELAPLFDDAVVKYALSKGLEDHVAEKSGGTFNMEVATNAIAKKKKPKRKVVKPELVRVDDGEVDGMDRTASGTYGSKKWELETDDGMTAIYLNGKSIEETDPELYDAILTTVNDEGYELEEQRTYKKGTAMNLQENYKRLFKGKASSNDRKLIRENMNDFKFSYPSPAFESKAEEVLKAMENDMLENFDSYDDWVEYGSDSPSREVEDLTDDLVALDPKKGYTVDDWMEEVAFPYIKKNHG
jgi:hypothetical protein